MAASMAVHLLPLFRLRLFSNSQSASVFSILALHCTALPCPACHSVHLQPLPRLIRTCSSSNKHLPLPSSSPPCWQAPSSKPPHLQPCPSPRWASSDDSWLLDSPTLSQKTVR